MADIGENMNVSHLYKTIYSNIDSTIEDLRVESFIYKLEIKRIFNTKQYYELIDCIEYVVANQRTYKDLVNVSIDVLESILIVLGNYRGTYRRNAERVVSQVNKLLAGLK